MIARNEILQAVDRFLEQRTLGNEAQQLLWTITPAQRPEALAAAAGENEGVNGIGHVRNCK